MSVDVLICVHSQNDLYDRLLSRALDSLVHQTYKDFAVVLVMDECHEETHKTVERFNKSLKMSCYSRSKKEGLAAAKNFGIERCTGEWIAYLDADDAWDENKLQKQVDFILKNPEYSVVGTQAWDVYDPLTAKERWQKNCFELGQYKTHEQIASRIDHENVICHGSVMVRRKIFSFLGYPTTDEAKGQEDWLLWKYLVHHTNYKFYNIPERLYYYSMNTSVPR